MPTYKVGFPYIVIDAPDKPAAVLAYQRFVQNRWTTPSFGPEADLVEETADYAVDAEGNEIVDGECTPSTKHPGRCAECGEPVNTREEE